MHSIIRRTVAVAVTTAAAAAFAGPASAEAYNGAFKTPTGNIVCTYSTGYGGYLGCNVRSADVDYIMSRWGFPHVDQGAGRFVAHATLHYGYRARIGAFTCRSYYEGLRCTNRGGHGFFLSKQQRYRF